MAAPFTPILLSELTAGTITGTGIFDVLMKATKAHLDSEFEKNRIKGPEYSTVYLGSLQQVLATSLQFQIQQAELNQNTALKELQAQRAAVEVQIATAQLTQIQKQNSLVDQQILNLQAQKLQIDRETALTDQKILNAVVENDVLVAQKCKLQAEFDVIMLTKDKTIAETTLLQQKLATEKAQILSLGVDADSVVGRQKSLYVAQTEGFARDAEQKAAKIIVDTWNVRRTTDEATSANSTNKLDDATVGAFITKLKDGVGA